jgi:hypothetical protein
MRFLASIAVLFALAVLSCQSEAHTDSRGFSYTGLRHPRTGIDCCSDLGDDADCKPIAWSRVKKEPGGWRIDGKDFVPDREVMSIEDPQGLPTVCRLGNGPVRCFGMPGNF